MDCDEIVQVNPQDCEFNEKRQLDTKQSLTKTPEVAKVNVLIWTCVKTWTVTLVNKLKFDGLC